MRTTDGVVSQVSWIRQRDLHILTVGILTYTSDARFQVIRPDRSDNWTLQVKFPQERDSGVYECQVNTEPKMSLAFRLNVVGEWPLPRHLHHRHSAPTKRFAYIAWGRGGAVVRPLAFHEGESGSILGGVLPNSRTWESSRTMPLVDGFSREPPVSPPSRAVTYSYCTALCTDMPMSTAHSLSAVTVEGDDWATVLQEVSTPCAPMGKRSDYSPPTEDNRARFPAGPLMDFRTWESCRTMPPVGGFSLGSAVYPRHCASALLPNHLPHPHRLSRPR
ncbi:hypothetical protein PR048_031204, partial [Dryococelus australis]